MDEAHDTGSFYVAHDPKSLHACRLRTLIEFPHPRRPFDCACLRHSDTSHSDALHRLWRHHSLLDTLHPSVHAAYVSHMVHQEAAQMFARRELEAIVGAFGSAAPLHLVLAADARAGFQCAPPVLSLAASPCSHTPWWITSCHGDTTAWLHVGFNVIDAANSTHLAQHFGAASAVQAVVLANVLDMVPLSEAALTVRNLFKYVRDRECATSGQSAHN